MVGLTALAAVAIYAQTVTRDISLPDTWQFTVDGTSYLTRLEREAVVSGVPWNTAKALPMSFAKAEQIARAELRKLVSDEPAWEVHSFQLHRLKHTQHWYYSVEFSPPAQGHKDSYAYVLLDASGKAGSIEKGHLN